MFVHYCLFFMSLPLNSECFLCFVFVLVIGSFPSTFGCQRFLSLDLKSTLASLSPPELKCLVPGRKKRPFQCVVFSLGTAAGQLRVQR